MFDSREIDSFFESTDKLQALYEEDKRQKFSWLRFIKLGFPCLAALLFGVMIVMPNIKKSVDLKDNITLPRKNELEKLHIEETVFNAIDGKNRVSTITADNVDEIEPGSHTVKINNPKGNIPTDSGEILISSDFGYFSQDTNVLNLNENVKAVVNGDTVIITKSATYNFDEEKGFGKDKLTASGSWGKADALEFTYDKKSNLLILIGKNKITTDKGTLEADDKTKIFKAENKVVAIGNAMVKQGQKTIKADTLIAFFTTNNRKDIERIEAYGNVSITTPTEQATGAAGYYDVRNGKLELFKQLSGVKATKYVLLRQDKNTITSDYVEAYFTNDKNPQIKYAQALGNVLVTTEKGTARGSKGVYNPQKKLVELFGAVQIEQDGNFINGSYAQTDLATSISRIQGDETTGGRISGIFYNKRKNKNGSTKEE